MIRALLSALTLFLPAIVFGWILMKKPSKVHVSILMITSLISYLIWRINSPYPYPLNWDIWEHQTVVNAILAGKFAMFSSLLSDTFGFTGYTTLFHMCIAAVQYLWKPDILGFWWFAELYTVFLMSITTYALTFAITKKRTTALVAGVLSSFLFESTVAFTPLFLIPQTVAAYTWACGLILLIQTKKQHHAFNIIGIFSLIMILFHGIIGIIGCGVYILWYIGTFASWSKTTKNILYIAVPCFIYISLMLLTHLTPIGLLNHGEAASYMTPISDKITALRTWFGFFPLFLIPIGIVAAKKTWESTMFYLILFLLICISVLIISPIPYAMKFVVLARFLVIPFYTEAIIWIRNHIPHVIGKHIFMSVFFTALITIYGVNTLTWKQTVQFQGIASQVSHDEQAAALFLKQTYSKTNTMIVSDPSTSYILEGLSGINSPGGAYMNTINRHIIAGLPNSQNDIDVRQSMTLIEDGLQKNSPSTYLWIVSARYFSWLNQSETNQDSFAYNTWSPQALSLENRIAIQHIEDTFDIQPVFQNASIVIFSIPTSL